jgi:hypothetical protein
VPASVVLGLWGQRSWQLASRSAGLGFALFRLGIIDLTWQTGLHRMLNIVTIAPLHDRASAARERRPTKPSRSCCLGVSHVAGVVCHCAARAWTTVVPIALLFDLLWIASRAGGPLRQQLIVTLAIVWTT